MGWLNPTTKSVSTLVCASGALGLLGSTDGCGGGSPAAALRPADPTYAEAVGAPSCHLVERYGAPLVVDWRAEQRGDLEIAMRQGVAVVAYDCHTLRLLEGCAVDGTYGFMGMTTKEEVVRLENEDEVEANLPLTGAALAAKLGGDLKRGTTLDVALVMVGKRMSTWRHAARSDLHGDCEGATHFVRGATVGAFVMQTGARASATSAAEIFGSGLRGASASSKSVRNEDGHLDACKQATVDAVTAPDQCGAILRLELTAIGGGSEVDEKAAAAAEACPNGLVRRMDKCTQQATGKHECRYGDLADCTAQCDVGDSASCFNLGMMYFAGREVPPDVARAVRLSKKACDGDFADGCTNWGAALESGDGVASDVQAALAAYDRGCKGGSARGCTNLGALVARSELTGVKADFSRVAALYRQGCDGGDDNGCNNLGTLQLEGHGVPKDSARALAAFKRGCDGGDRIACVNIAVAYIEGDPPVHDEARARALLRKQCDAQIREACGVLKKLRW